MPVRVQAALLVFVFLAGCTMSGEKLSRNVARRLSGLDGYYAEVDAIVFSLEGEQHYQVRQWLQFPARFRIEVDSGSERQVFLCDGEQVFVYQPELADYYLLDAGQFHELPPPFLLVSYLEQLGKAHTLQFTGREQTAKGPAYVVSYKWAGRPETVMLRLDTRTLFPLMVETYEEGELLNRLICTKLILNPTFPQGLFEFSAPDERRVSSHCLIRSLSLDEASNTWPFPIYIPGYLPAGAWLVVISRGEENGCEQLTFIYGGENAFVLVQRPKNGSPVPVAPGMKEVPVGESTGVYQKNKVSELHTLWWDNETSSFILTGDLPFAEMLRVAESLTAY